MQLGSLGSPNGSSAPLPPAAAAAAAAAASNSGDEAAPTRSNSEENASIEVNIGLCKLARFFLILLTSIHF